MIRFACPGCTRTLNVKDELAGKHGKCPACGQVVVVPASHAVTQAEPPSSTLSEPSPAAKLDSLAVPSSVSQGRQVRWSWYAGGSVAALCIVAGVVFFAMPGKDRSSAKNGVGVGTGPAPNPDSSQQQSGEEWQRSPSALVARLTDLMKKHHDREAPRQGDLTSVGIFDAQEVEIWRIRVTALPDTLQGVVNSAFSGKRVAWPLVIEKLERSALYFRTEEFAIPKQMDVDSSVPVIQIQALLTNPETAKDLRPGQKVVVQGKLEQPNERNSIAGVVILYGEGPNKGKRAVSISLEECIIETSGQEIEGKGARQLEQKNGLLQDKEVVISITKDASCRVLVPVAEKNTDIVKSVDGQETIQGVWSPCQIQMVGNELIDSATVWDSQPNSIGGVNSKKFTKPEKNRLVKVRTGGRGT